MKRAVVTRPEAEARRWVSALEARGWQALALPLIVIGPPADSQPLSQARARLADHDALMFVSSAAVTQFFSAQPWGVADSAGQTRCWAPGPATARALLAAGVPPERIDQPAADAENFDSESLWREVGSQLVPGHRLLIVRGQTDGVAASPQGNGRDWLAQQCLARGGSVDWCVAYRRQAPGWGRHELAQALAASRDGSVWLLSSSEALDNLARLLPAADWSQALALATHPRIAAAARRMGFGRVLQSRPSLAEVLSRLESIS
jgi:uroporphyrinogen-III synthase